MLDLNHGLQHAVYRLVILAARLLLIRVINENLIIVINGWLIMMIPRLVVTRTL